MSTVAKKLVDQQVDVATSGGQRFSGVLEKVADDGQAIKLTSRRFTHYVCIAHISAFSIAEHPEVEVRDVTPNA